MSYSLIEGRLVALSFIVGPIVVGLAAALYIAGVSVNPGQLAWGSSLEGAVGAFGYVLLIPPFFALAAELGRERPKLAASAAVSALFGFGVGAVMNMTLRVVIPDLEEAGVTRVMFDALMTNMMSGRTTVGLTVLMFSGPLGPLASILLGVGFAWSGRRRALGGALVAAGVSFWLGQLFALHALFYLAGTLLWVAALAPIGWRRLVAPGSASDASPAAGSSAA